MRSVQPPQEYTTRLFLQFPCFTLVNPPGLWDYLVEYMGFLYEKMGRAMGSHSSRIEA